jgi:hypothetical protein
MSGLSGMVYIYFTPDAHNQGMDESTAKTYQDMLDILPTICKSIKLIPRASTMKGSIPAFDASDLGGFECSNSCGEPNG